MKTKWIAILVLCAMAAAFFLGAKGVVKLNQDEAAETSDSKHDMLVGLLLVPETDDCRFEQEAATLTEAYPEKDTEPFAAFCEKSGAIRFLSYFEMNEETDERVCWVPVVDPYFTDLGTYVTDDGVSLRGTILTMPDITVEFDWFYVYQKYDGSLYTKPTEGIWLGQSGGSMTVTGREEYTETFNGETKTSYSEVVLTIQGVNHPTAYDVLAFDAAHVLLERTTYAPDAIPEALRLPGGTAYVLVERREIGADGPTVSRTIYQAEDYGFDPYCDRGDGLCETQYCEFVWPE